MSLFDFNTLISCNWMVSDLFNTQITFCRYRFFNHSFKVNTSKFLVRSSTASDTGAWGYPSKDPIKCVLCSSWGCLFYAGFFWIRIISKSLGPIMPSMYINCNFFCCAYITLKSLSLKWWMSKVFWWSEWSAYLFVAFLFAADDLSASSIFWGNFGSSRLKYANCLPEY